MRFLQDEKNKPDSTTVTCKSHDKVSAVYDVTVDHSVSMRHIDGGVANANDRRSSSANQRLVETVTLQKTGEEAVADILRSQTHRQRPNPNISCLTQYHSYNLWRFLKKYLRSHRTSCVSMPIESSRERAVDDQMKRTSSNLVDNSVRGKASNLGPAYVSDITALFRFDGDEVDEHVCRRRRISMKSSSSANDGGSCAAATMDKRGFRGERINDIRSDIESDRNPLELPDPKENISPDEFLMKLVKLMCNVELEAKTARSLQGFFCSVSDEQMAAYTIKVVSAVRTNDLEALKSLQSDGQILNCFNRFGESLLTMACRRGFEDIVAYLLDQPDIDIRISDDSGRTVLHDACWNPSPQLNICKWILEREPALFFVLDNRGCSAFHYARPEHWGIWRRFLLDNRKSLTSLKKDDVLAKFAKST